MDGQRNDRLGRAGQFRQQFEHRRQILRPIWSNANRDPDFYGNPDTHCYCNADSDCDSNSYSNSNCNSDPNSASSNANANTNPNAKAGDAWKYLDSTTSRDR